MEIKQARSSNKLHFKQETSKQSTKQSQREGPRTYQEIQLPTTLTT